MPRVFFDTSALVPVVTEQLLNHAHAHARFVAVLKSGFGAYCSAHTLAECYATLTALPLPQRITAIEAARLIEHNFARKLRIVNLTTRDYRRAIDLCANASRTSGQIYDALHVIAAQKTRCDVLLTYNLKHFQHFASDSLTITAP